MPRRFEKFSQALRQSIFFFFSLITYQGIQGCAALRPPKKKTLFYGPDQSRFSILGDFFFSSAKIM